MTAHPSARATTAAEDVLDEVHDLSEHPHHPSSTSEDTLGPPSADTHDPSSSSPPTRPTGPSPTGPNGTTQLKSWMKTDKELVEQPENNLLLVMPSIMLVLFLAALDQTITATALPTIATVFDASPAEYSWASPAVGTSYLLASTVCSTLWGRLSDIVGRKAVLYPGILAFVAGSALCGASQSMTMLIVSRSLQGIGGSAIMSLTQFIVGDVVPLPKRGLYGGFLGMVWAFAAALGPICGGLLTEKASWRWCFFINLPTAGVAFAFLFFFLKLNTVQKLTWKQFLQRFDFSGLVLLMGGAALLVVAFATASDNSFGDKAVIALLVVGALLVVLAGVNFSYVPRLGKTPLIPPRMFKNRTTALFLIASTLQAMCFLSASYYLPVFFQGVLGVSSLMSGVYLIPFSLMVALGTIVVGQINNRYKIVRPVAWAGYAVSSLCFGVAIKYVAYEAGLAGQLILLGVAGLGIGLCLAVPLLVIQAAMPLKEMAASTSAWILTRSCGGSLGIALFQAILSAQLRSRFPLIPGYGTDFQIPTDSVGYDEIHALPAGSEKDAVLTAFSQSLRTLYIIWCPMFGTCLLITLFTKSYVLDRATGGTPVTADEAKQGPDVEKGELAADEAVGADAKENGLGEAEELGGLTSPVELNRTDFSRGGRREEARDEAVGSEDRTGRP